MARSRGGSRPMNRRPAARPTPTQTRSASTMAAPASFGGAAVPNRSQSHAPAQAQASGGSTARPQNPGLFAQMASTAAGVAVGSAVGHTIGAGITGLMSGSGSDNAAAMDSADQPLQAQQQQQFLQEQSKACDVDARNFTRCLDENNGNFQICDYYLQQLKACQEAARYY